MSTADKVDNKVLHQKTVFRVCPVVIAVASPAPILNHSVMEITGTIAYFPSLFFWIVPRAFNAWVANKRYGYLFELSTDPKLSSSRFTSCNGLLCEINNMRLATLLMKYLS
jgi:hypothetical protein